MAKYIPFIMVTVLANAAAQILLKKGMSGDAFDILENRASLLGIATAILQPFVLVGLCLYVLAMGAHLVVLSKLDVSVAYPLLSLAYVVVALYAFFVMHETFGVARVSGLLFICVGTWLVTTS